MDPRVRNGLGVCVAAALLGGCVASKPAPSSVPGASPTRSPDAKQSPTPTASSTTLATESPPRSLALESAAITGAKQAVRRLTEAQDIDEFAEALTNDSAATMSLRLMRTAGKIVSASDDPAVHRDFSDLAGRFGLPRNPMQNPERLQPLRRKGRSFLAALAKLLEKHAPNQGEGKPLPFNARQRQAALARDALTFTEIDAERVGVVQAGQTEGVEARFEDGRWRMHLVDFDKVIEDLKQRRAPAPSTDE